MGKETNKPFEVFYKNNGEYVKLQTFDGDISLVNPCEPCVLYNDFNGTIGELRTRLSELQCEKKEKCFERILPEINKVYAEYQKALTQSYNRDNVM